LVSLLNSGVEVTHDIVKGIVKRFSKNETVNFDDYIFICINLQRIQREFKKRENPSGLVTLDYETFVSIIFNFY
jgi:hypothetical protein